MPIRIISQKESITVPLTAPVLLIDEAERLTIEIEGSIFTYSRITFPQMRRCDRMSRAGNVINDDKATDERLKACIKDWQGVEDGDGNELKYDTAIIPYFPGSVKIRLDNALGRGEPDGMELQLDVSASVEVRRLTSAEHNAILAKHTQRGILDRFGAMEEMLSKTIISWQGFGYLQEDGTLLQVAYESELLKLTPQHAFVPILEAIQSHTNSLEAELGN